MHVWSLKRSLFLASFGLIVVVTAAAAASQPTYTPPDPNPSLPLSKLPNARPPPHNRTFVSHLVEAELQRVAARIGDKALRRLWLNCYPNSLDTTVAWHDADEAQEDLSRAFPRSFFVTGDITASWLRDSASQMNPYLPLLLLNHRSSDDKKQEWDKLYRLALGLVYMQSQFVLTDPFANSFGPPRSARDIPHGKNAAVDASNPDWDYFYPPAPGQSGYYQPFPSRNFSTGELGNDGVYLWESKWEVDSIGNFFRLQVDLAKWSGRADFVGNSLWKRAVGLALEVLKAQMRGTEEERDALDQASKASKKSAAEEHGKDTTKMSKPAGKLQQQQSFQKKYRRNEDEELDEVVLSHDWETRFKPLVGGLYRFQRLARTSTETRSESGLGEPAARIGMVKSAFRPSDDATMLPFFVPGNALLAVNLQGLSDLLLAHPKALKKDRQLALIQRVANDLAQEIRASIHTNAIKARPDLQGDVFAYEVDGYGSAYYIDDANIPSLLSLPYLGFVDAQDEVYQRTRSMVLSSKTNKYFFNGSQGAGIGGPHVGWGYAWPMSRIMQILTSTSVQEKKDAFAFLRASTAGTGLMHESVNVNNVTDFTRSWFGWVNGLFGEAILSVVNGPDADALLGAETYSGK